MSNAPLPSVACALSVGAQPEPFLGAMLESIAETIDVLAVNDNSGLSESENVRTILGSRIARSGRLLLTRNPFSGFGDMRNSALLPLRTLHPAPAWILHADADEVHGYQLDRIVRETLPRLPPRIGSVDAYVRSLFGTFDRATDIGRRVLLYRLSPETRWVNSVHEKLLGMNGRAIVVPYVFAHYGGVAALDRYIAKSKRYEALASDEGLAVPLRSAEDVFAQIAVRAHPFNGPHPSAARATISAIRLAEAERLARIERAIVALQTPKASFENGVRHTLESVRVLLRFLEHPGLYRATPQAR
ncbi:MAG TPA: hypothetical protein VGZ00_05855 [Candidatus Baltobacteraceae bacterium]|jgi:hypothetical protein|nr:hypothetical protein [Candidatus Baltobacteraceae bacterium]